MQTMIQIDDISHAYDKKIVLHNIHLSIEKGERCALVGRNGAGKSTLIHLLLNIMPLKKGKITLAGHPNKKQTWKQFVSYLPEKFDLYPHLSGYENMQFFATLSNKKIEPDKINEKLKLVSLWNAKDAQVKGYSKGMLQRLGLAIMLYYDTDIIILDEPTSGLDPIGRADILKIITSLTGKTILMASHHMSEIEQVCTHVAYLDDGKMTKYDIEDFLVKYKEGAM
ncbi:ABC transporter ATP-binding protein [Virgibacillus sp. MSJ-26]|uniref:ABC transporter ATP-binding protein n=1 Tax=Virgibacillus sp. MSJ-26 TaxID=2841522 RepID=UPI00352FF50F